MTTIIYNTKVLVFGTLLGLLLLVLTGCSTPVPVIAKFPDVPAEMLDKCPQLKTIDKETTTFSNMTTTVTENYTQYYICANKSDSWIEWYNTQKKIYESIK